MLKSPLFAYRVSMRDGSSIKYLAAQQRRRRLELPTLHLRHELRQFGMARRRHADLGALACDEPVHLLDLGAPALEDVLRHRWTLDVGAGVGAGLRVQHAIDGGERLGNAFGGI